MLENTKNDIINIIGDKEYNKFIQILESQYIYFDAEGYLSTEIYLDYGDIASIEEWIQDNFLQYNDFNRLYDEFLERFYYDYEYDYFQPIRDAILCLDIASEKMEELEDYIYPNVFFVDYDNVFCAFKNTTVKIDISLQSKEDRNRLDGKQLIKKYIPRALYKEFIKDNNDFNYYSYVLSSVLEINIVDFYNLKDNKKIKIEGSFIMKDPHNGSYYDTGYNNDGFNLSIKTNISNINFNYGYSIEEISGDDDSYICKVVD